nr:alpha/beta fold hydrolase [Aeromonas veronii]
MSAVLLFAVVLVSLTLVMLAAALLFGGPSPAPAMASINDPFKGNGWSNMPPLSRYPARDGTQLAYRHYGAEGNTKNNKVKGSVVLVHGSSASSQSMHKMASAFSQAGYDAYALDIRGHGASGHKGTISYIGQLEDDLEDFIKSVAPRQACNTRRLLVRGGLCPACCWQCATNPVRELSAALPLSWPHRRQLPAQQRWLGACRLASPHRPEHPQRFPYFRTQPSDRAELCP